MKLGANDVSAVKIGATDVNKVYLGSNLVWEKAGATLLLDLYPNAAAAYSLRKLRTAYAGASIKVRRSSDNTEQDIGFVGNELDTASLLSFVGAGDGFVVKRYDQSGNGHDLEQTAESKQPKIVNAGALYTFNGKPYFLTDGVNDVMRTTTNPIFGTDSRSLFFVQKTNVTGVTGRFNLAADTVLAGRAWLITPEVAVRTVATAWISSTPTSITSPSLISNIYTSGNLHSGNSMWLDGVSVVRTSGNDGTIDTIDSNMTEGANSNANFYNGYISESIIYKTDQSANRAGIESNINSNYNIYWDGSQTGLLDDYPNASAAYSLRALNSDYTGAAIKVRRSSDNTEQDIGFLYDGSLDTSSLLSFVGAGDGFVSKWYDQSGVGNNDAVQASASAQPQIVSSGSVINENGKISVKFNGTTDYIQNELSVGGTVTTFAVSKIVDELDFNFIYDSFGGTGNPYQIGRVRLGCYNIGKYFADNGDGQTANPTTLLNGLQNLFFAKHTNSNVSISVNQDALQTRASTNFYSNTEYFVIGARNDGAEHFLEGTIQELILYPSDQSGNRAAIETNINTHYTIY